jgi:hypothetical protein
MAVVGSHPFLTIVILFIIFFTIFFLVIYGILRFAENRKPVQRQVSEEELSSQREIPTYVKSKNCAACGTSMPGIASFCPECGTAQPRVVST